MKVEADGRSQTKFTDIQLLNSVPGSDGLVSIGRCASHGLVDCGAQ